MPPRSRAAPESIFKNSTSHLSLFILQCLHNSAIIFAKSVTGGGASRPQSANTRLLNTLGQKAKTST